MNDDLSLYQHDVCVLSDEFLCCASVCDLCFVMLLMLMRMPYQCSCPNTCFSISMHKCRWDNLFLDTTVDDEAIDWK